MNDENNKKENLNTEKINNISNKKKLDQSLNESGSQILNKMGVPKFIADKAIKKNGGQFSPGNLPGNKLISNASRNIMSKSANPENGAEEDSLYNEENKVDELENLENEKNEANSSHSNFENIAPKAQIKSTIGNFLLKNPYILIIIIIVFVLLFFVLFLITSDFDIKGTGDTYPEYYATACNKVYLVWENDEYVDNQKKLGTYVPVTNPSMVSLANTTQFSYKEYDFNSYVTGIIWNDNNNALDVQNETVYEAMAVAARSRVVANLGSNCVVLRDYNSEHFSELSGTEQNYDAISSAVSKTTGLVVGKYNNILNAKYDTFSYISKYKENDENAKNIGVYYMMNKNETGQQTIPASWVVEKNIPTTKVLASTYLESMSLYGAKYLLEKQDSQYDLYRILEYYYGRDIKYYTVDYAFSNSYNTDCSDINMKSTSLSKEDFIARVNAYNKPEAQALKNIAGTIYDMGVANGVNPELVFIRADVEGYSPGASKNNYWGMGCTNTGGYAACKSYSSIEEGVAGFLKNISQYATLTDLTGKYAYLGDYWYNPGSSSVGGCYYAEYIYPNNSMPDRVKDACASGKSCSTSGGSGCVATSEEDKYAYLVYQSRSMISARKRVFGLDSDSCATSTQIGEPGSGSCTIWKQGDPRWGSINLGSSSETMSNSGCAVTSIAIAMSCSGTTINNVAMFNPGVLVQKMNASGAFTPGGGISWSTSAIQYFAPQFTFGYSKEVVGSDEGKIKLVTDAMNENGGKTAVLVHFKNDRHLRGHWVVLKSISGTTLTVYDPAGKEPDVNNYQAKDLDDMRVYKYS